MLRRWCFLRKVILIVEDYADVREIMKIYVRTYGYEVLSAADGYEAVGIARHNKLDLILMDLTMPIMDGLTATEIIRGIDGLAELPIVALTANRNGLSDKAIEAGCNEIVGKPLDFNKLGPLLGKYLS
jgi:CheY-like chemotaxis protein